jgi:hypothetical protein
MRSTLQSAKTGGETMPAELFQHYRVVDVDTHLTEPPDLWTSRVSSKWGEAIPPVENVRGTDLWMDFDVGDPDIARRVRETFGSIVPRRPPSARAWRAWRRRPDSSTGRDKCHAGLVEPEPRRVTPTPTAGRRWTAPPKRWWRPVSSRPQGRVVRQDRGGSSAPTPLHDAPDEMHSMVARAPARR